MFKMQSGYGSEAVHEWKMCNLVVNYEEEAVNACENACLSLLLISWKSLDSVSQLLYWQGLVLRLKCTSWSFVWLSAVTVLAAL